MTDIVEAMARAIKTAEDAFLQQAGDALDGLREEPEFPLYETMARAALTAVLDCMMEPSEGMVVAGMAADFKDPMGATISADCYKHYRAMLDQLRKEAMIND